MLTLHRLRHLEAERSGGCGVLVDDAVLDVLDGNRLRVELRLEGGGGGGVGGGHRVEHVLLLGGGCELVDFVLSLDLSLKQLATLLLRDARRRRQDGGAAEGTRKRRVTERQGDGQGGGRLSRDGVDRRTDRETDRETGGLQQTWGWLDKQADGQVDRRTGGQVDRRTVGRLK